jgi:hypothetical protein
VPKDIKNERKISNSIEIRKPSKKGCFTGKTPIFCGFGFCAAYSTRVKSGDDRLAVLSALAHAIADLIPYTEREGP